MKKAPFTLGYVSHVGISVRDPQKSAAWYIENLGLKKQFEFEGGVAVYSDAITLVLHKGKPSPGTIGHIAFFLPDVATLKKALAFLRERGADLEDPGDEIGREAPRSKHVGLWLHDPDGYRIELSVLNGAKEFYAKA